MSGVISGWTPSPREPLNFQTIHEELKLPKSLSVRAEQYCIWRLRGYLRGTGKLPAWYAKLSSKARARIPDAVLFGLRDSKHPNAVRLLGETLDRAEEMLPVDAKSKASAYKNLCERVHYFFARGPGRPDERGDLTKTSFSVLSKLTEHKEPTIRFEAKEIIRMIAAHHPKIQQSLPNLFDLIAGTPYSHTTEPHIVSRNNIVHSPEYNKILLAALREVTLEGEVSEDTHILEARFNKKVLHAHGLLN